LCVGTVATVAYWKAYDKTKQELSAQAKQVASDHVTTLRRDGQLTTLIGGQVALQQQASAELAAIHELLTSGTSAAAVKAKQAVEEAAQAVKLDTVLEKEETTSVELLDVDLQVLEAAFPYSTLKVTCSLSKTNQIDCHVVKTPKKGKA